MRINRAVGAVLFLIAAHIVVGDMFGAFSNAFVSTMRTFETASDTATLQLLEAQ